jgi:hypothetical protein
VIKRYEKITFIQKIAKGKTMYMRLYDLGCGAQGFKVFVWITGFTFFSHILL